VIQGNHDEVITSKNFSKKITWFNEIAIKSLKWTRNKLLESDNCSQYEYLGSLKPQMEVKFNDHLFMISHGTPDENWGYFLFPFWKKEPEPEQKSKILSWVKKWDIVVLGHTHQAFVYKTRGKVVINPGSVGQPRDGDSRASYGVVEFSKSRIEGKIIRIKYDIKKTCEAIFREELDEYLCQRLISGV